MTKPLRNCALHVQHATISRPYPFVQSGHGAMPERAERPGFIIAPERHVSLAGRIISAVGAILKRGNRLRPEVDEVKDSPSPECRKCRLQAALQISGYIDAFFRARASRAVSIPSTPGFTSCGAR